MDRQPRGSLTVRRASILTCTILCLLATVSGGAQSASSTGIRLETGLQTFFTGEQRSMQVTVTEVGTPTASSRVYIAVVNAREEVVASGEGDLRRKQPVQFELPLEGERGRRLQLRVVISILGPPARGNSRPIVVLEQFDPNGFTIGGPPVSCAAATGSYSPVTPNCPDFAVTQLTTAGS